MPCLLHPSLCSLSRAPSTLPRALRFGQIPEKTVKFSLHRLVHVAIPALELGCHSSFQTPLPASSAPGPGHATVILVHGHALCFPASVSVLILTCCLECCLEIPRLRDFSLAFANSSVTSSVRPSVASPERETLALFVLPESPTYFCSSNADMGEGVLIGYHKLRALQQPKFILSLQSGGQKSKIEVSARLHSFWRLQRGIHFLAFSSF